ncbi:MAG: hypothetical protein JXC85_00880 [Candidatus Aenigmarchaeota archaeon]|nr:hypothetical protein [Candidatus Aenigmarchaeota archaeon]
MAKGWERSEAVVAQRISALQIGGLFSKKVRVLEGETALLEEDGRAVRSFEHGEHKVGGLFSGAGRNVVFVDKSPKVMRRQIKDLWTKDDKEIVAAVELKVMVTEPEKLGSTLLTKRDVVMLEDVWAELRSEISSSVMAPVVKKKGIDELQGDRKTVKEIQVSAEVGLRRKLQESGLSLASFSVEFILPDEYQDYLKKRGALKEETEREKSRMELDTEHAIREREIGEIRGTVEDREQVLDEMEKERIKRETELGLEEEETQNDMRDAMEALKLKEIKDKQKIVRDKERKRLGLESLQDSVPAGDRKQAKKRYDELRKIIEATERKYLDRKLDKQSFSRLMQKYEEQKTELEVAMKKDGKGEKGKKGG